MSEGETTPATPEQTEAAQEAIAKQLAWQTQKLSDRLNRAMQGYPVNVCSVALGEMFYRVLSMSTVDPVAAAGHVIGMAHRQHEVQQPKIVEATR